MKGEINASPASLSATVDCLLGDICRLCLGKGHREGPGVNNPVPHDCIAAFQMAKSIVKSNAYECYVAVAPEGHMYGYFFESLGAQVQSVFVDYPPDTHGNRRGSHIHQGAAGADHR